MIKNDSSSGTQWHDPIVSEKVIRESPYIGRWPKFENIVDLNSTYIHDDIESLYLNIDDYLILLAANINTIVILLDILQEGQLEMKFNNIQRISIKRSIQ